MLILSNETFNAITRLQDEIGIYIEEIKKSEYEREKFERQSDEKDQARMRFQRRLNTLTDSDKNVISLKDILPDKRDRWNNYRCSANKYN